MKQLTILCSLVFLAAACSSETDPGEEEVNCDLETRADTYAAGMSKVGGAGLEVVLIESSPTPPSKGDNTWTIQVMDGTAPATDATVNLVPFMPDHQHGTSISPVATATGAPATFEVTPINLWMPGLWEVSVDIDNAGATDQVVYSFCIEG